MSFIRMFVGRTSGVVRCVVQETLPSERGAQPRVSDEELDEVDVGFVLDHDWTTMKGESAAPSQHFFERVGKVTPDDLALTLDQAKAVIAAHPEMPKIYECPCTLRRIRDHVQSGKRLHGVVRAWLAAGLAPEHVDALNLAEKLPLSALKAADYFWCKRDPHSGSNRVGFERAAQRLSDAISKSRHAKRRKGHALVLAEKISAAIDQRPASEEEHVADLKASVATNSLDAINAAIARVERVNKEKKK